MVEVIMRIGAEDRKLGFRLAQRAAGWQVANIAYAQGDLVGRLGLGEWATGRLARGPPVQYPARMPRTPGAAPDRKKAVDP